MTSTSQALEYLFRTAYKLIISDMSRGSDTQAGLELLRRVKQYIGNPPPLIIYSRKATTEFGESARQEGAVLVTWSMRELTLKMSTILYPRPTREYLLKLLQDGEISTFNRVRPRHLDFSEADLKNTNLSRANFTDTILIRADLTGAGLTGADLTYAKLDQATLTRSILSEAIFKGTTLHEAAIDEAKFNNADLSGAQFWGAREYRNSDFTNARFSSNQQALREELKRVGAVNVPE
ncbi:MAG TPA: pentapeptide repeat-containing protein [Nitrososphaeraceae archaeon]|nr:pentapeptide repeat-containing protein [Nitrososphaeraceae archaeon]